jgi:hypothetical protein
MKLPPPSAIRRTGTASVEPPPAFAPCPSVIVVLEPLVQVTDTEPALSSAVEALALTGS